MTRGTERRDRGARRWEKCEGKGSRKRWKHGKAKVRSEGMRNWGRWRVGLKGEV